MFCVPCSRASHEHVLRTGLWAAMNEDMLAREHRTRAQRHAIQNMYIQNAPGPSTQWTLGTGLRDVRIAEDRTTRVVGSEGSLGLGWRWRARRTRSVAAHCAYVVSNGRLTATTVSIGWPLDRHHVDAYWSIVPLVQFHQCPRDFAEFALFVRGDCSLGNNRFTRAVAGQSSSPRFDFDNDDGTSILIQAHQIRLAHAHAHISCKNAIALAFEIACRCSFARSSERIASACV